MTVILLSVQRKSRDMVGTKIQKSAKKPRKFGYFIRNLMLLEKVAKRLIFEENLNLYSALKGNAPSRTQVKVSRSYGKNYRKFEKLNNFHRFDGFFAQSSYHKH